MTLAEPLWLLAIPAALAAAVFLARWRARRRSALPGELGELIGGEELVGEMERRFRRGAEGLGGLLLVLALATPRVERVEGPAPKPAICVVDVSRSMLAEDESGRSRFARAKELLGLALAAMEGRRVGLITFAGEPDEVAPPTTDLAALRALLDEVDPRRVADPGSVASSAIEKAIARLERSGGDLFLLSDGEWQAEGTAEPALATAALANHVVIHAIPLGGEAAAPLVAHDSDGGTTPLLDRDGRVALSRADRPRMAALARATHGRALEGELSEASFDFAAPARIDAGGPRGVTPESALLAAALLLLAAAHAMRERIA